MVSPDLIHNSRSVSLPCCCTSENISRPCHYKPITISVYWNRRVSIYLQLCLLLLHVQHRTLLDLRHRDLATRGSCQGLFIHNLGLGHWLWHDNFCHPYH